LLIEFVHVIIIVADSNVERTMVLSASEWARHQWAGVQLGDRRLERRAVEIGSKMAAHPEASLPNQMETPSALKAAYGMLNHPAVTLESLTAPHRQHTLETARRASVVLLVEDTTELDYTAHPRTTHLGPIGDGRGHGLLLHSTLAVIPATREVVGLAHLQVVRRQPTPPSRPHWTRSAEGQVWQVSAAAVGRPPAEAIWVHVSDRGSDIFEYLIACVDQGKHFLIRAFHNRRLTWADESPQAHQEEAQHLLDYARNLPAHPDCAYLVSIPARHQQPARQASLALQWTSVILAPPSQAPLDVRRHPPIRVWLVRVWEPDAPPDVQPLEWILLTSLTITSLTQAQTLTDWYTCRWLSEDYHQCLKTGCRIERSQLDDGTDIERLLGFAAPIALRLLQLRQTARQTPDVPATAIVEPLLVQVLARRQKRDSQTMTAQQFWQAVARLGGHQGRRRDGPPGWRTVWRGWRYLSDLAEGARLFAAPDTS
jgi:hypothetical protein